MSAHWTLGVLIGIPVTVAAVGLLLWIGQVLKRVQARERDKPYGDEPLARVFKWVARAAALALLVGVAIGMYPWSAPYHQFRPVSGTVDSVSSRFISSGDSGTTQNFLVVIDGKPYRVDDTRAAGLKAGDHVDLMCVKSWQWSAAPGQICRWGATS